MKSLAKFFVAFSVLILPTSLLADSPTGYYSTAYGKTGDDLKSALHVIIDNHTPLPYTKSGNDDWFDGQDVDVWEALLYTDSSCPDDQPSCGRVQLQYLDDTRGQTQANLGAGKNDSWDREHV